RLAEKYIFPWTDLALKSMNFTFIFKPAPYQRLTATADGGRMIQTFPSKS
ncbi:hypothetical protein GBF38_021962, partial [Nibea albiflora]